jgi:hypothetical protein
MVEGRGAGAGCMAHPLHTYTHTSITSYLMFLILLLKSFWSWHMTLVGLIKLWTAPLFYMMWVVGLEVQITTSMNRFLVHIHGQFWTLLHDQNVQKCKGIISFSFCFEIDGRSTLLRWWRNCCNLAGPYGQTMKVSLTYLSHLVNLWCAVSNAVSTECYINMLLTTGDSGDKIYAQSGST